MKKKIIAAAAVLLVLAVAFYFGGNAPGSKGWTVGSNPTVSPAAGSPAASAPLSTPVEPKSTVSEPVVEPEPEPEEPIEESVIEPEHAQEPDASTSATPMNPEMKADAETGKDKYQTDPVPEGKPIPVEPQDVQVGTNAYTCTLSVACSTILDNMDLCDPEKTQLVPEDGWILEPITVAFYEGESVFNVLQRTCKQQKIHMEYEDTPIYNSAYIEGIANLYEFDVGEKSGWMYKVNEWFPNYGCSRYQIKNGDVICWVYTCDLGNDVGGRNAL